MKPALSNIFPTETVQMALGSLRSNKFRSALTVLGIVVGIITVVLVASILTGLRSSITSMIEEYGTNNIYAFHLSTGPRVGNRDRSAWQMLGVSITQIAWDFRTSWVRMSRLCATPPLPAPMGLCRFQA